MASPCYYAATQSFSTCSQRAHVTIWMRGRRGPEERRVCSTCSAWLSSQGLADASLVLAYNAVVKELSVVPALMLRIHSLVPSAKDGEATPPKRPRVSVDSYVRKNEPQSAAQWDGLRSLWVKTQRTAWKSHRKDGIGYTGLLCVHGRQAWLPEQSESVTTASL